MPRGIYERRQRATALATCHPSRKHYARGMCEPCYDALRRSNGGVVPGSGDQRSTSCRQLVGAIRASTTTSELLVVARGLFDLDGRERRDAAAAYAIRLEQLRPWRRIYNVDEYGIAELPRAPVVVPSRARQERMAAAGDGRQQSEAAVARWQGFEQRHGTGTLYDRGCRCDVCRTANAERHRARRAARGAKAVAALRRVS